MTEGSRFGMATGTPTQVPLIAKRGKYDEDQEKHIVPGILKKMHSIMAEIGHVGKDQKNAAQGFRFRGIDQFQNKMHGLLIKHKVIMVPRMLQRHDEFIERTTKDGSIRKEKVTNLLMNYEFIDIDDGSTLNYVVPSEGMDSGDKSTGKALSGALKYAFIQGLCTPTEDMGDVSMELDEADKESPTLSSEKPEVQQTKVPTKAESRFKKVTKTEAGDDL